jgi:hypothetical protein
MAFKNLSIRIPEEALGELEKLAQERNQKVSDVARELIVAGLKNSSPAGNELVIEYLQGFGMALAAIHTESTRARYYGELMVSYGMDMQSLMIEGKVLDKDAKEALLDRFGEASVKVAQESWFRALGIKPSGEQAEPQ